MRVVILEPFKEAYVANIGSSLHDMQEVVGGYIEALFPFDDPVALICDEAGKLKDSLYNRVLRFPDTGEAYDIVVGTCFIVGAEYDSDEFSGLSPELAEKYRLMFRYPDIMIPFKGFGGEK